MDIDIDIKNKFIEDFPIPKGNKTNPYIILFDANIGVGKSTVSKLISKHDNSIILNNDEIRLWLSDYHDRTGLLRKLQEYRLEELLKNGNSCICDRNFNFHWKDLIKYFDSLGYRYYIIRLKCSDNIIKDRLSKRNVDLNEGYYSIATFEDYLDAKKKYPPVDDNLIDFEINTEGSHEQAEKQVIGFLKKFNLLEVKQNEE